MAYRHVMSATDDESGMMVAGGEAAGGRRGFFAARWNGEAPLTRLFWIDMMVVGSLLNVAGLFVSLLALGFDAPLWAVAAIHFSPVPYNLFLFASVWRTAARADTATASAARLGAALWLAVFMLI